MKGGSVPEPDLSELHGNLGNAWTELGEAREANILYNIALAQGKLGERDRPIADTRPRLVIFRSIESPRHVATVEAWPRGRGIEP
jgi:hypothetical protein